MRETGPMRDAMARRLAETERRLAALERRAVPSDGEAVVTASTPGVPPGVVMEDAGTGDAPDGWLVCDGAAYSRATYADLYARIGTTYGAGDGSTTFNVPDYRGRVGVGPDGGAGRLVAATAAGVAGGSATHTLTAAQMPVHSHAVNDPSHAHGPINGQVYYNGASEVANRVSGENNAGAGILGIASTQITDFQLTGVTVQNAGSGASHPNDQPWLAVRKIIKT